MSSSTALKVVAEVLLACAVLVVLTTDVLIGTPLDRWPFVVGNVVVGLVGWMRPARAGWALVVLCALLSVVMLIGSASLDAPTAVVVGILVCPLAVAALFLVADRRAGTRAEAPAGPARKRLRCRLGFHELVSATVGEERFLRCKHCGKYGGSGTAWGVWTYRE